VNFGIAAIGLFWALSCSAQQQKLGPSPVDEVGVYYQKGDDWVSIMPEVVNWKTGGVMKSIGTMGVVKGDVNGKVKSGSSRTKISSPVTLLVFCPEGTAITEYQLIHFHNHSNSREFRTVTGGVFHVSSGSERDTMEFDSKHIAQRTWTLSLEGLQSGEYGILPPGMSESRSASAHLGKMYTFMVARD
jgi:hypothetical protein